MRPMKVFVLGAILAPASAFACAACYGQSDAPMAQGMNWGILSLLGVIVAVLGGVASFFIYLARRVASAPELEAERQPAAGQGGEAPGSWPEGAQSPA